MKLLVIDQSNYDIDEILDKCREEISEVDTEVAFGDDIELMLAEAWDLLQASFSLLVKLSDGKMELLEESNEHHIRKLSSRGHNILGEVEIG